MSHLVITIGCEYGAKGNQIGKQIAEDLGFKFYDRNTVDAIIHEVGLLCFFSLNLRIRPFSTFDALRPRILLTKEYHNSRRIARDFADFFVRERKNSPSFFGTFTQHVKPLRTVPLRLCRNARNLSVCQGEVVKPHVIAALPAALSALVPKSKKDFKYCRNGRKITRSFTGVKDRVSAFFGAVGTLCTISA